MGEFVVGLEHILKSRQLLVPGWLDGGRFNVFIEDLKTLQHP
jgi:hypothetical protein